MATPGRSVNGRLTGRQAFKELAKSNVAPEFFLVEFLVDMEVCAVPLKFLVSGAAVVGEECQVKWTNGETYTARVLASGTRADMKMRESELYRKKATGKENIPNKITDSKSKKAFTPKKGKSAC